MTDTRNLSINIDVKSGELARVNTQLAETEKRGNSAAKSMTSLGVGYLAVSQGIRDVMNVARPVLDFFKEAVKLSSDLAEAQNLATVSFGKDAEAMRQWARTSNTAMTETGVAVQSMAARYFVLFKNQGIAREEALQMSQAMTDLTGDIGSFMNLPVEEAFAKLRSGLAGESEPLKQLNVFIQEADVKTRAYTDGLAKQGEELTRSQKLLSRYNLIMDQTGEAQGDLERTSDSYANVLRNLTKRWEEYQAEIGKFITNNPFLMQALNGISDALDGQTNAMSAAERQGAPYIEMMRAIGVAALDAAGMVGRFSFAMQGAAAYGERYVGWLTPGDKGQQKYDNANQRLDQLAADWHAFDTDMKAARLGIQYGTTGPNLPGAAGGVADTGSVFGGGGGKVGKAKRDAAPRQSLMDIMVARDLIEGAIGSATRLWGDFSFNDYLPLGAAGSAFGGITSSAAAQSVMARQRLMGNIGMSSTMGGGWGSAFNPFSMAAGSAGQRQRAGGVAGSIFGSITGNAAGLDPQQTPWYMTGGAQRWGGVAGGLMGGGLSGGLSAAGSIFGSMLGPLGGLAGGWLGNKLGGLFGGGGGKKRPDAGLTPAQPLYTAITNLEEMKAMFLSVTQSFMLMGAGRGIDAGTAGLQAAAGFKSTMPAMRG